MLGISANFAPTAAGSPSEGQAEPRRHRPAAQIGWEQPHPSQVMAAQLVARQWRASEMSAPHEQKARRHRRGYGACEPSALPTWRPLQSHFRQQVPTKNRNATSGQPRREARYLAAAHSISKKQAPSRCGRAAAAHRLRHCVPFASRCRQTGGLRAVGVRRGLRPARRSCGHPLRSRSRHLRFDFAGRPGGVRPLPAPRRRCLGCAPPLRTRTHTRQAPPRSRIWSCSARAESPRARAHRDSSRGRSVSDDTRHNQSGTTAPASCRQSGLAQAPERLPMPSRIRERRSRCASLARHPWFTERPF
jgi:hypothetical protein